MFATPDKSVQKRQYSLSPGTDCYRNLKITTEYLVPVNQPTQKVAVSNCKCIVLIYNLIPIFY